MWGAVLPNRHMPRVEGPHLSPTACVPAFANVIFSLLKKLWKPSSKEKQFIWACKKIGIEKTKKHTKVEMSFYNSIKDQSFCLCSACMIVKFDDLYCSIYVYE